MSNRKVTKVDKQRAANLRQRLLRASRAVNSMIVKGLHERGFKELRSTHTALLSNLEIEGSRLTYVAQQAGMTKQAMGRLAEELIRLDYIKSTRDKDDQRAVNLMFTVAGIDLMRQSFAVMGDIEQRCRNRIGKANYQKLLDMLSEIVSELEVSLSESE